MRSPTALRIPGGSAYQCYYLDGGTYSYRGTLYAYNTSRTNLKITRRVSPLRAASCKNKTINNFKRQITPIMPKRNDRQLYLPAVVRNAAGQNRALRRLAVQRTSVRLVCSTGNMKTAAATAATTSATWAQARAMKFPAQATTS